MDQTVINLINGISSGLLLFMLSSGLTLIFSMMGVLNFAHASFYMLGAYFAYTLTSMLGFTAALVLAPILVGLAGALFERSFLRRVHRLGHVAELLVTFGLSYVIIELVQLAWGRVAVPFRPPGWLQGPAFTIAQKSSPEAMPHVASLSVPPASGRSVPSTSSDAGVCDGSHLKTLMVVLTPPLVKSLKTRMSPVLCLSGPKLFFFPVSSWTLPCRNQKPIWESPLLSKRSAPKNMYLSPLVPVHGVGSWLVSQV